MEVDELNRFVIGALLHDIGKFRQRAAYHEDQGKSHSTLGYEWLASHYGEGLIAALARNHHGHEPETWESNLSLILYEADNLAASERKTYDPNLDIGLSWQSDILLASEFSRIRIDPGQPAPPMYWPMKPLGEWIEPQKDWKGEGWKNYRTLWEMFLRDFDSMKERGTHYSVPHLLVLLEKYTSFIPSITLQIESATDEESFLKHPDVSLFDHLRITAAAAFCLYQYLRTNYPSRFDTEVLREEITFDWQKAEPKPFLLIGGDLSGVQRFIYTLSSKGALKSLKGRSFFLELLTEFVVDRILEETKHLPCNVIFTGGGHFYILGANTESSIQSVQKVRKEVNDYLFRAFNGDLFQCIEWVPMGKIDFKDATEIWAGLSGKLNDIKKRKWKEQMDWLLSPPTMPSEDCLKENCEVCGREDQPLGPGEINMCPFCREQFSFGEKFQRLCRKLSERESVGIGITIWNSPPSSPEGVLSIGDPGHKRYYQPVQVNEKMSPGENVIGRYRLNDWSPEEYDWKDRFLMAGLYHHPELEDMEAFVREGFGIERAAILRMDVDHLGKIFSEGLSEGDRSFSRKASLSRQFSLFFKYHLNGLLDISEKNGYRALQRTDSGGRHRDFQKFGRGVSLVYAGGDDLFLIGQWLDCLESAFDIHEAFHRFTGNPGITLSGGWILGEAHQPIYRFAKDTGKALDQAKKGGRNSLCFFNQTLKWSEAKEVIRLIKQEILPLLTKAKESVCLEVPNGSFSKGFLYRLLALVRDYKREGHWILPKAAYLAGRNGPSLGWLEKNSAAREAWMAIRSRIFQLQNEETIQKLEVAIVWTLMMLRKGEGR